MAFEGNVFLRFGPAHDRFLNDVIGDISGHDGSSARGLGRRLQWARSSSGGSARQLPRSSESRLVTYSLAFFPSVPSGKPTFRIFWRFTPKLIIRGVFSFSMFDNFDLRTFTSCSS